MAYRHNRKRPVIMRNDPIDPESSDWVYFSYTDWLLLGEEITSHSGIVTGGTLVQNSTYFGALTDKDGTLYRNVYGVMVKPDANATKVVVTHRKSTYRINYSEDDGEQINTGRLNIDHSAEIPVRHL